MSLERVFEICKKDQHAFTDGDLQELRLVLENHPEWIENRFSRFYDMTPFLSACFHCNLSLVQELAKLNANVNAIDLIDENAIMECVLGCTDQNTQKCIEILEFLFELPTFIQDINAKSDSSYWKECTPFGVAYVNENSAVAKYLLSKGANPDVGLIKEKTYAQLPKETEFAKEIEEFIFNLKGCNIKG